MINPMIHETELMISEEVILEKIASLAKQIDHKYQGESLVIVMVLKGALCFVADLIRQIRTPFILEVVQCKSYGAQGSVRGDLTILGLDELNITGQHILVVDDIFDSGITMTGICERLYHKHPKSLSSAVLLCKRVPRAVTMQPDYVLFSIDNEFVVGYGLDFKEHYRGLRGIYKMMETQGLSL